jgi:uncharacterized protein (TIGR03382 family)
MKRHSIDVTLGTLGILLPGGVGVWVVARTLASYWGRDPLASMIVFSIGAALLVGLWELIVRKMRAEALERELRLLPPRPQENTLDGASPLLGNLLRARLEHAPMPSLGENTAPFLTGLLVMLGLLGTLLGLFQTVAGAGHALTTSSDVDALRRSLSAPIEGLTRSFGCSAAGISASAMLGLALAVVRRRENRMLRAVYGYATGPLRVQSPVRRQARALEQLVSQGQALPDATAALEGVSSKLGHLSNELVELQQTALKSQQRAFSELLAALRGEVLKAATDAGEGVVTRVSPLVEQLSEKSAQTLASQAEALTQLSRQLKDELCRDEVKRREDGAQALAAMQQQLEAAEAARAAKHAERESALSERWQELLTRLDAQVSAARDSERERLASLDAQVSQGQERESARLRELSELAERVGAELTRLSAALATQLEQRTQVESQHDARAERTLTQLSAAASALEQSLGQQSSSLKDITEQLPPLFQQTASASQAAAERALSELAHVTEQRLTSVSQLLEGELAQRAGREKTLAERAEQAFEHVQQSAGLVQSALSRQSGELEGLFVRVGQLLPQLVEAAQTGATETLERLQHAADAQAERFAELEAAIERGRDEHARGLAAQLQEHAGELEKRLAEAGRAVEEAAGVWRASSAEMQALTELWSRSVEQQREAAQDFSESFADVEGAVERAGHEAARAALSDQLAATQEVFTRQLQFQRELFEQLRGLRSPAPRVAQGAETHGEADAPV